MDPKLHKFTGNAKITYDDLIKKLDEKEEAYIEFLGSREGWSQRIKQCFSEIRMAAICKQYPAEESEDIERQYESRNSRENDNY